MNSEIWLYIALGIAVVGLIIAGIGIGIFISGIKEPIKKMKGSADNLKERMNKLNLETSNLQHHTAELKEDVQLKSEKISMVVNAAQGAKNSVVDLNSTVRAITKNTAERVDRDREHIEQVDQWSTAVIGLLDLWERRKGAKKRTSAYKVSKI